MSKEVIILIAAWTITIVLLIVFVPKEKIRHANVIFLFKQFLTWPLGLVVVELGLIKYPVRIFKIATQASFSFEYFVYPAFCVLFNLYYPENEGMLNQAIHYFVFTTGITIIEATLEQYTNVITYIHWSWFYSWLSLLITFGISRQYYRWYFKKIEK